MNPQGSVVPQTFLARENLSAQAELTPLVIPQLLLGFGTMHSWAVSIPHCLGFWGRYLPWRAVESRSFASGIQPSSLRASLSETLRSSQPSPPGCPQQDRQLCRASTSLGNKCPQSPGTQHQNLHLLNHCCDNPVCSVLVTEGSHNQEKQQDYPPAPVPTERIIIAGCTNDIPWVSP